jgi:hypothetical protein
VGDDERRLRTRERDDAVVTGAIHKPQATMTQFVLRALLTEDGLWSWSPVKYVLWLLAHQ